jgi:hypothetical protein
MTPLNLALTNYRFCVAKKTFYRTLLMMTLTRYDFLFSRVHHDLTNAPSPPDFSQA